MQLLAIISAVPSSRMLLVSSFSGTRFKQAILMLLMLLVLRFALRSEPMHGRATAPALRMHHWKRQHAYKHMLVRVQVCEMLLLQQHWKQYASLSTVV
jgi:hypothetical protein